MNIPACTAIATPTQLSQPPKGPKPPPPPNPNQPFFPNPERCVSLRQRNKPVDPVVLWTSSIARSCRNGRIAEGAAKFARMRLADVEPNNITFVALLSGCADFPLESVIFGASVHGYVRKLGLDKNDVMVGTALVGMYAKCGRVDLARVVFDGMGGKNSVSWNTMIDGYMRNGEVENAVELFDQMPKRDAISWTALMGGFIKKGHVEQALVWFREMQLSGVEPDYVTIIAVLSACANLGTLALGLWINRFVMKQDYGDNIRISNSLIDMYSRCGCIQFARQVFENMQKRTLVSWNSIIVGFAVNGHAEEALEFFSLMQNEGFKPDGVSFTGALTACSHAGLVDEGLQFFDEMNSVHRLTPRIEHFGCIVDLYGRAGRLEDAFNVIENMPMKPNEVVLGSLLAACKNCGNVSLAERLMNRLSELDPGGDSNYVLLANIYAAVGRWDGAGKIRRKMKSRGIQKKPGFSSIEVDCSIHKFVAGDKSHADKDYVYEMLELLSLDLKLCGYVPETIEKESYDDD
ncbi:pentatricopeptide repeat-containing protein At1g05750, chloroplastic-like [Corylus avellana]|uniref:pentatricopeptide repeat-containing protein At1g05750, chloroplastic-like n=1 Tax=Corylus avellana TaxID=13451 RepID=UPI001E2298FD|nr:pentatricopeptide repeat-containing protein At1g05750, chloroplastic-like [Corylus avellana]